MQAMLEYLNTALQRTIAVKKALSVFEMVLRHYAGIAGIS
jgi:hypothetical protein